MLRPRGLCGLEAKLFGLGLGPVVSDLGLGLGLGLVNIPVAKFLFFKMEEVVANSILS